MRGLFVSAGSSTAILLASFAHAQDAPPPTAPPVAMPPAVAPAPAPEPLPIPPYPSPPPAESANAPPCAPPPPRPTGLSLGLRVGYGFPLGSVARKDALSSNLTGMLPVWLDAGYRVSRQFYIGAYFQWAAAFVADDLCPKNLSCSAYDLRAGANVHWHFKWMIRDGTWAGPFDPWIGLGTGYEGALLHVETVATAARSKETFHAFEYANLQLGADYFGAPWHLGAFFGLSLAEYLSVTQTNPNGSTTFAIPDPALHLWLSLGLRGQYDL